MAKGLKSENGYLDRLLLVRVKQITDPVGKVFLTIIR
jgi:hypothetical protein